MTFTNRLTPSHRPATKEGMRLLVPVTGEGDESMGWDMEDTKSLSFRSHRLDRWVHHPTLSVRRDSRKWTGRSSRPERYKVRI